VAVGAVVVVAGKQGMSFTSLAILSVHVGRDSVTMYERSL
jgi:hypothetical protein